MKKIYCSLALLLAAAIWGFGFVAQSVGLDYVGPWTFQSVRCLLGALALTLLCLAMDGWKKRAGVWCAPTRAERQRLLRGGLCCGLALGVACALQQTGLQYTTVAKAGFITSMYLVLVPIASIAVGRKPELKHWFCVALAAVGLYFLSISGNFSLGLGDTLVMCGAVGYTVHIMVVDHYASRVDGVKLSCIQFWVASLFSAVGALCFEHPDPAAITGAMLPILYSGIVSSAGGYTLQIIGQSGADPVVATLLMGMESVFSLIGGVLLLHQVPSVREGFGCVLVFAAVLFAQLPIIQLVKGLAHKEK